MRRWWQVLVALSALAALGMALVWVLMPWRGSAEAQALAQRAAEALETVTVRGTVRTMVLTPRGPVEARAEIHRGAGRAHIRYLSGPAKGVEVYRDGATVWSRGPEGGAGRQARLGDGGWSLELMRRNWRFRLLGDCTVAGRSAQQISARGPGGRLTVAVDRETGFPLMIRRSSQRGRTLSETVWETADFSVGPPPRIEAPPDAQVAQRGRLRAVSVEEAARLADFTLLAPTRLPKGFTLQGWFVREGRRGVVVQARYTDGVRPLLVIQQRAPGEAEVRAPGGRGWSGQRRSPVNGPAGGLRAGGRGPASDHVRVHRRGMRMRHGPMMHLRATGGRAVRGQIDGVLVTVIGPDLGEALTDVLASMAPVTVN